MSALMPAAKRLDVGTTKSASTQALQAICYRCRQVGHVIVDCLLGCKPFKANGNQRCKVCTVWISKGDLMARPRNLPSGEETFVVRPLTVGRRVAPSPFGVGK